MSELKAKIQTALNQFANGALLQNAKVLLNTLGYESDRTLQLSPNNYQGFAEQFQVSQSNFNPDNAKTKDWKSIDIIFQLTQDDIRKTQSLFDAKQVDNKIIESYLFFVLSLKGNTYSRGDLVRITREINKLTPMPSMLLFRYNDYLTISVIDRRLHKREASKDVLEKVTLIKDINIKKPHRAHIEILYDLSLQNLINKYSISNFVELHNTWRKTLDTSELNKKFFRELANWYFWAMNNVEFPDDIEKKKDVRNAISLIRLITRVIFIWFIKEKDLVPEIFFNKTHLDKILKNFNKSKESITYYPAILQNLFFGTLNQKMSERGFAKEGSFAENKSEYGVKNLFRYVDRFTLKEKEVIDLFKDIPFLNGGLFDCLDKPDEQGKILYVDGFSRNPKKQARMPDFLFFSNEQEVDLNEVFGTRNKKYTAKGLINLLESYKFTVAENTPIEEEVALDPELLGKVFENLLASYNPETQTTARKQTGSFYTPREIVNYMVDESLIAYLNTALSKRHSCESRNPEAEQNLRHLLAYNDEKHKFTSDEVEILIAAIDNLKALDPACGSGAFPMGILHKLVHILHKLDPKNEQWKKRQIEKAKLIDDPNIRQNAISDIEAAFESNELDYGRKLYLIENSIYGVDIQSIAVQIAKLRFFISLIIDEKKQPGKENLGIRSLPNLETKFVAANTLIGLDKPQGQQSLRNLEIERLEKELKWLRHEYFNAKTRKEKLQCQRQDKKLRQDIAGLLVKDGWNDTTAQQIVKFDPYDQNASAEFFDPEWMFGIKNPSPLVDEGSGEGGFDVVIGNPPYVDSETMTKTNPQFRDLLKILYKSAKGNWDLFVIFIEKGLLLTQQNGSFSYIVPNKLIGAKYTEALREILLTRRFIEIRDYSDVNVFKEAAIYPIVFVIKNSRPSSAVMMTKMSDISTCKSSNKIANDIFYKDIYWDSYFGETSLVDLILKVSKHDKLSKHFPNVIGAATVNEAYQIKEVLRELNNTSKGYKKFINTGTIDKYCSFWGNERTQYIKKSYYKPVVLSSDLKCINPTRLLQANSSKIIIAGMAKEIEAFYDNGDYLAGKSTSVILGEPARLKVLTAILNSRLISFWFAYFYNSLAMAGGYFNIGNNELNNIPIANFSQATNIGFDKLVDQILAAKKKDTNADTSALERKIDKMVYELYGLTPKEIEIVEGVEVEN